MLSIAQEGPQARVRTALSSKQAEGKLIILEGVKLDKPKTAELAKRFAKLGFSSVLFIDWRRSSTKASPARRATCPASTYCRSKAPMFTTSCAATLLVLTRDAVTQLEARLK